MAGMEEREQKSRGAGCAIVGVVLILLPVLYILSAGPAFWLWGRGSLSDDAVEMIYAPLYFASDHSEWANDAFSWYVGLWLA